MVRGQDLWDDDMMAGFGDIQLSEGKKIKTYESLPINFYEALRNSARKNPEEPALADDEGKLYSYEEMVYLTNQTFDALYHDYHIRTASRVAVIMQSGVGFCRLFFALQKIGAMMIPLPTKFKKEEVLALIEKSSPDFIICSEDYKCYFDGNSNLYNIIVYPLLKSKNEYPLVKVIAQRDNPSVLLFTSGTTAQSKPIYLYSYQLIHAAAVYQRAFKLTHMDKAILPTPIYHVTGLVALLGTMILAGGLLYIQRKFNAEKILDCIQRKEITYMHASPTVFHILLEYKQKYKDLSSLRILACGSGNISPEAIQRIHHWIPSAQFRTVYGLTETTSPASIFPCDAATSPFIGSSGLPIPGVEIMIQNEDKPESCEGMPGEVLIRGTNVAVKNNEWLKTGDIGYLNSEYYLFIVDRKKDMINCGGEKIWCIDVENALCQLPGIKEAAVVGIPDPLYEEVPVALVKVVERSSYIEENIYQMLSDKIAKFKIPHKICKVEEIPKTSNGKIDKRKIRNLFIEGVYL